MFLLGCPANTRSMTSCCCGEPREVSRCVRSPFHQLARVMRQIESSLDTCEEFLAADRLFDEIQCARFHRLDSHRTSALPVIMIAGK